MTNRTPTPWEFSLYGDRYRIVDSRQGLTLARTFSFQQRDKINAAFIVRAVNSHDALVNATEWLRIVLPMAKGYAAQHKVGSNARYIKGAQAALAHAETHLDKAAQ